jgi:proteasome component ECM29
MIWLLGDGVLHKDDIIGNAFADGLSIALSYETNDAPILDNRLFKGSTQALIKLSNALRKYGNGDHTDAPRALKVVRSAGICLAATTSGAGCVSETDDPDQCLGPARLQCVEALFLMLGSTSFRKDEEIALVAGEALAFYADAFSPEDVVWSSQSDVWPKEMDEDFAKGLPPHQQVRGHTRLRKFEASSGLIVY